MIEITRVESKYLPNLQLMMKQEGLDYKTVTLCLESLFVVVDRLDVLGFGYYNAYDGEVYLDHLYIRERERFNKLGDSLFRAILNSLMQQGTRYVYMRNLEVYRGFLKAEDIPFVEERFVIDTHEFFTRKCKGSKAITLQ